MLRTSFEILIFRLIWKNKPSVASLYLYDSQGNRVKKLTRKQGGNYEIRTYIDGVFEYYTDETDEQNTVHIMDDKSRICTLRIGDAMGDTTPAIKFVLENNIGSSSVQLDNTGSVVNEQEYYPFGETSFGSHGKKRYQYVGKERDEESGMYYYGARYYSPWIGRFVSVDPLAGKYAQLTPYNYADQNPINDFDIDGMQSTTTEETANPELESVTTETVLGSGGGGVVATGEASTYWDEIVAVSQLPGNEELADIVSTLNNSDFTYFFSIVTTDSDPGGSTSWDVRQPDMDPSNQSLMITIYVPSDVDSDTRRDWILNALGDELVTAMQFESGQIGFAARWDSENQMFRSYVTGYDWRDEVNSKKGSLMLVDAFGANYVGSAKDYYEKVVKRGKDPQEWLKNYKRPSDGASYLQRIGYEGANSILSAPMNGSARIEANVNRQLFRTNKDVRQFIYIKQEDNQRILRMGHLQHK